MMTVPTEFHRQLDNMNEAFLGEKVVPSLLIEVERLIGIASGIVSFTPSLLERVSLQQLLPAQPLPQQPQLLAV
jgi:hypothetical protein